MGEGGGLYVIFHEVTGLMHPAGLVRVTNCLFDSNTLDNRLSAGAALHINSHNIPGQVEHVQPQYLVQINSSTFFNSSVVNANYETTGSTVFIFQSQSGVHITNCTFISNNVTGLSAGKSNIIFSGEVKFEGNRGINGGGLLLCDRSFIYLTPYTNVSFVANHAVGTGGGIYVSGLCLESIPGCFFQFSRLVLISEKLSLLSTVSVKLVNNTAGLAGNAIYGSSVDYCIIMNPWLYTPFTILGEDLFDSVFKITHEQTDFSYLTSDPYEVCFCSDPPLARPNCSSKMVEKYIYPGSNFTVMVVVVGQRHGTVPGAVKAITEPGVSLGGFQTSQDVTVNCTALSYKVKTALHTTDVELRVQHSLLSPAPTLKLNQTFIRIHLKECPIGFTLYDGMCVCTEVLANRPSIECVLDPYPAILHSSNFWIGYYNSSYPNHSGIIYYEHCPPGYCTGTFPIIINTSETSFDQNMQCSSIREGLLCGSCPHGTSVVVGSQECLVCSSVSSAIVIFALMAVGIVVVVCMNAVPMLTVTSGEINGLVFYANVMQIMLGPYSEPHVQYYILSLLNLDQGVKTCFYNGMDTFAKVFIESVFPLYLFVLALFIIFSVASTRDCRTCWEKIQ